MREGRPHPSYGTNATFGGRVSAGVTLTAVQKDEDWEKKPRNFLIK